MSEVTDFGFHRLGPKKINHSLIGSWTGECFNAISHVELSRRTLLIS